MSNKKKPRNISVPMDFGRPTRIDRVGLVNGEIVMISDGVAVRPSQSNVIVSYERPTKPKIISGMPLSGLSGHSDLLTWSAELALRKYNFVYAIDTNTRPIRGEQVSVSAIVKCTFVPVAVDKTLVLCGCDDKVFAFRNIQEKPENTAWRELIEAMLRNPQHTPALRIGLIVDSDLGNLAAFNGRSLPVVADFYLPEGFTLIYASSDVGTRDSVLNAAIRLCDNESSRFLDRLERDPDLLGQMDEVSGRPYTHWCVWSVPR